MMRLIRHYFFYINAKLPFSQWPQIVHRFLEEQGLSHGRFLYCFEDFDRKSCDRAAKDCPTLGEPEYVEGSAYGAGDHWILSNIHKDTPCTEAELLPLMKRIHRTYGLSAASLYYYDVDFFGRVVPMERDLSRAEARAARFGLPTETRLHLSLQPRGSGIQLYRDRLSNNTLSMSVELLHDGHVFDPTPYFEGMKALLPGVSHASHLEVILSDRERAQIDAWNADAGPLLERIRQFFTARLPGGLRQNRFPSNYRLAPTLKKLSKARGYRYQFDGGIYSMEKQTKKGQHLILSADSGPSRYDASFALEFVGLGYRHRLCTAIFLPTNQQEFDEAAARVFDAVAEFDSEFLSELTAHFPAVPDWFTPEL